MKRKFTGVFRDFTAVFREFTTVSRQFTTVSRESTTVSRESTTVSRQFTTVSEQALEVYYTAEKLARDPEHAELIPVVERMRHAYQNDYGRPIPPRKKA